MTKNALENAEIPLRELWETLERPLRLRDPQETAWVLSEEWTDTWTDILTHRQSYFLSSCWS